MQMIQILITGGTFDKSNNHLKGDLYFKKTHIPEMLERSKSRLNVNVKTLMMIDSLEMTENDIEKLNELISLHKNRIKPRSTFKDGYLALKIANAAYQSLKQKKVVKLK